MNITLVNVSARMSSDGSRLISSLLKRAGHRVTTIFLARPEPVDYLPSELECLDEILKETDLVLIAVYSSYAIRARQITDYVRTKYPGLMVIWGGLTDPYQNWVSIMQTASVFLRETRQSLISSRGWRQAEVIRIVPTWLLMSTVPG